MVLNRYHRWSETANIGDSGCTLMPLASWRALIPRSLMGLERMGDGWNKVHSMDEISQKTGKLTGRAFYQSIGSPKFVLAPMVDRSEFVGSCLVDLGTAFIDLIRRPGDCSLDRSWVLRNRQISSLTRPCYIHDCFARRRNFAIHISNLRETVFLATMPHPASLGLTEIRRLTDRCLSNSAQTTLIISWMRRATLHRTAMLSI